jgi:hypothetical protein
MSVITASSKSVGMAASPIYGTVTVTLTFTLAGNPGGTPTKGGAAMDPKALVTVKVKVCGAAVRLIGAVHWTTVAGWRQAGTRITGAAVSTTNV